MGAWNTDHGQWNATNTKAVKDIDDEIRLLSTDLSTRLDGLMDFGTSTAAITQLNVGKHQNYRDTKVNLEAADAVIPTGVIAFETDTKAFKLGDGTTSYASLPYFHINYETQRKIGEVFFDSAPYERPGCKWTDYSLLSQSVYAELFSIIGHLYAKSAADATSAESAGMFRIPDGMFLFSRGGRTYKIDETAMPSGVVLTITGHGFATDGTDDGRPIKFLRRTPSASPTIDSGIAEYTQYYIAVQSADTVRLYTTEADAIDDDGSTNVITFSGDGSGDIYASTMGCYQADAFQDHGIQWEGAGSSATGDYNSQTNSSASGFRGLGSVQRFVERNNSGTPRTTNETRPAYASFGMQIKVAGTSVTGETYDTLKYDTGVVSVSDWTANTFTVNHGLSAPLEGLIVKFYIIRDSDSLVIDAFNQNMTTGEVRGIHLKSVDADNIAAYTATNGVKLVNPDTGASLDIQTTGYSYRCVVYKPDLFTKVKEVVDQEWALSGNGVQTYTLPDPGDVSNVILRWTGGTPDTDEVQIQAGTTINGIDSEKWILEGEGFLELIPNKLATGFLTRNTGIWDTYDVTYEGIEYPQDKYTNGKIVRRGAYYDTSATQAEMYSVFSGEIPNVGEALVITSGVVYSARSGIIKRTSSSILTYKSVAMSASNSQTDYTIDSDGSSGTWVTSWVYATWETKNTKWSV